MDRDDLLARMRSASCLNDISSAIADARAWFADHPDDADVRQAFFELTRMEREQLLPHAG
jgi:hypothetical protein